MKQEGGLRVGEIKVFIFTSNKVPGAGFEPATSRCLRRVFVFTL